MNVFVYVFFAAILLYVAAARALTGHTGPALAVGTAYLVDVYALVIAVRRSRNHR